MQMVMRINQKNIFDIIDLEDGNSLELIKKEKDKEARIKIKSDSRLAKYDRLDFIERKDSEHKGICQSCKEKKEYLRYILDYGLSVCYDCYIAGLQEEAWSYPYSRRAEDMDMYLSEACWEEAWEEAWEEEMSK